MGQAPMLLQFLEEEILQSIKECNFSKKIGADGFDGRILNEREDLRHKVDRDIAKAMNDGSHPQFIMDGRLIPLSKKTGQAIVEPEDIRPIVVNSQILKIIEKTLYNRIKKEHKHLLSTPEYQKGFKDNRSTAPNIAEVLLRSHHKKWRGERQFVIFVDLQKAYDNVNKQKIHRLLRQRCQTATETELVDLVMNIQYK